MNFVCKSSTNNDSEIVFFYQIPQMVGFKV